jgi:hypothetical protein
MEPASIVLSIISVLGTLSSIFFAVLAFRRNDRGEHKQEGKNEGVLISDVGYIKSSIDRIEKSIDKLEEGHANTKERLTRLETEVSDHIHNKSIHKMDGGTKK